MKFTGRNVHIGKNVKIGEGVKIGDDTVIYDNVEIGPYIVGMPLAHPDGTREGGNGVNNLFRLPRGARCEYRYFRRRIKHGRNKCIK